MEDFGQLLWTCPPENPRPLVKTYIRAEHPPQLGSIITLVVGGRHEYKVHKALLTAYSPVFKAVFNLWKREYRDYEVVLSSDSADVWDVILEWIYTGYFDDPRRVGSAEAFLGAYDTAERLSMRECQNDIMDVIRAEFSDWLVTHALQVSMGSRNNRFGSSTPYPIRHFLAEYLAWHQFWNGMDFLEASYGPICGRYLSGRHIGAEVARIRFRLLYYLWENEAGRVAFAYEFVNPSEWLGCHYHVHSIINEDTDFYNRAHKLSRQFRP